jgi:hypothetical protein
MKISGNVKANTEKDFAGMVGEAQKINYSQLTVSRVRQYE